MKIRCSLDQAEKSFGGVFVLKRITLSLASGEIYGLLGPNGAGKTTLLKLAAGLMRPDAGQVRVCGRAPWTQREVLGEIGVLIETPCFYDHRTVWENLSIHLDELGREGDRFETLERVGLAERRDQRVKTLSLGMRQRLAIARAIVHRPKLLLLDEPLNGLDPVAMEELRTLLTQLAQEGTAILLSSHLLGEVERVAHRIGVLTQGELVLEEPMPALRERYGERLERELLGAMKGERV